MAVLDNPSKRVWPFQLNMTGLAKNGQVLRRIVMGYAPGNDMVDDNSGCIPALSTAIAIPSQNEPTKSKPVFCLKALSYCLPVLFLKKSGVFVSAGIRAGLRLLESGWEYFIERTANHAPYNDAILRHSRALLTAETCSPFRCTRECIEWLLAGITNQMHTATSPKAFMRTESPTPASHGFLKHREGVLAIGTSHDGIGIWISGRTHSPIIA